MKKQIDTNSKMIPIGTFLIGAVIGAAVALIFMLIFAFIMLKLDLGHSTAAPFATIASAAGTLAAAFFNAKRLGSKGYLIGIATGVAVFLIILAVSLGLSDGAPTLNTLFHLIIMVLAGAIGGILGVGNG